MNARDTASKEYVMQPGHLFHMQRRTLNRRHTEKAYNNMLYINMREMILPLGCSVLTELPN